MTVVQEVQPPAWLTTVLRPAGSLDLEAEHRLVAALEAAATASDLVVVDVQAAGRLSRNLRRALRGVHTRLTARGGALVLLDPDGTHGLTTEDGEIVPAAIPRTGLARS